MNNIKVAFESMHKNPSIYKKKILSYLFDLQTNEEYHLSDSEFFNIVRETFKLNPTNFLKYIYNGLTDKVGKLYGEEKKRELVISILNPDFIDTLPHEYFTDWVYNELVDKREKLYGIWIYDDLTDKMENKEVNEIKKLLEKKITTSALKKVVNSYLTSKKLQHLSDTEFNNLIREVLRINPNFFLKWLYDDLMKKIGKVYGIEKRKDVEKFILEKQFITYLFRINPLYFRKNIHDDLTQKMEKFYGIEKSREIEKEIIQENCLYDGEQILYDFEGSIAQFMKKQLVRILGSIFVTNFRIIAAGKLQYADLNPGGKRKSKAKKAIINTAAHREFPFYGYIFPIKSIYNLKKMIYSANGSIKYKGKLNEQVYDIGISSRSFKRATEQNVNKLYQILKIEEERGEQY